MLSVVSAWRAVVHLFSDAEAMRIERGGEASLKLCPSALVNAGAKRLGQARETCPGIRGMNAPDLHAAGDANGRGLK